MIKRVYISILNLKAKSLLRQYKSNNILGDDSQYDRFIKTSRMCHIAKKYNKTISRIEKLNGTTVKSRLLEF